MKIELTVILIAALVDNNINCIRINILKNRFFAYINFRELTNLGFFTWANFRESMAVVKN